MTSAAAAKDHGQEPSPDAGARAEAIRLELADAWGAMGASWGVAPAIARVHAYLMARGEPLTEREVREALGLSHRAASLALAAAVGWGVVEKVPEPRRVGRRGPAGTAYLAVGDHFRWFSRVIAHRKRWRATRSSRSSSGRSRMPTRPSVPSPRTPSSAPCATGWGPSWASSGCSIGRSGSYRSSSPASWSGSWPCWPRSPTRRSCGWSASSASCRTTTSCRW